MRGIITAIFLILAVLALQGCGSTGSSSSGGSGYTPFSSYFKRTTGTSNLGPEGYPDHPKYEKGSLLDYHASKYLEGVKEDLDEIKANSENARDKIEAVSRAFDFYSGGYFSVSHVGSPLRFSIGSSNLGILGYPEFDDWSYFMAPSEPGPYADQYDWINYRKELLDFAATADAYIEDGKHYIRNCANDYETVRKKGLAFIKYLEQLERDGLDLDLLL